MIDFVVTEVDGDNMIRFDTQFGSHNGSYVNPCVQTVVAAAIAIYVVAGALTSVDQRLSRRADRGWGQYYRTILRVHSH